jgi:hypothetical protein
MRRTLSSILATMILAAAPTHASGRDPAQREYTVSCVPKGAAVAFYNRLATPSHRVVVTAVKPPEAITSISLKARAGEFFFLVEPLRPLQSYPGEVARICGIIVARSFMPPDTHSHDGLGNFIDPFGTVLQQPRVLKPIPFTPDLRQDEDLSPTSAAFLKEKVEELSGVRTVAIGGTPTKITERGSNNGRELTRTYLKEQYVALGYQVGTHNYGQGAANFIAERRGQDPSKVLIISSHLDSVGNAGADDNAAGTIAALAVARALRQVDLAINLRFVAFDQEEKGLIGSKAYAAYLNSRAETGAIVGLVNIEMPAFDSDGDGAFHVIDCNENTSATLTDQVMAAVSREGLSLTRVDACTNRSDHAPFWRYGVRAIVISENFFGGDGNPCYHRSCDKTDSLDFEYMRKITDTLASTVHGIVTAKFATH